THSSGAHFNVRLNVLKSSLEHFNWIFLHAILDRSERSINDIFRNGLLTVGHNNVHKLANKSIAVLWIWINISLWNFATPGHSYFPLLVPYFDRLCLRFATPTESKAPRTM